MVIHTYTHIVHVPEVSVCTDYCCTMMMLMYVLLQYLEQGQMASHRRETSHAWVGAHTVGGNRDPASKGICT